MCVISRGALRGCVISRGLPYHRPKMKLKTVNGTFHSSLAIKADSRLKCPVCNKHTPFDALYIDK